MKINLLSLSDGAKTARGIVVIIDVFRAYTTQSFAFEKGVRSIINVADINQAIGVQFLKNELVTINLLPQVGDIILYFNNFYEVDTVIENQYIMGKDPNFALAQEILEHGDSFSIIINAHMSRVEKLNLIPLRGGVYPITDKPYGGIANT